MNVLVLALQVLHAYGEDRWGPDSNDSIISVTAEDREALVPSGCTGGHPFLVSEGFPEKGTSEWV